MTVRMESLIKSTALVYWYFLSISSSNDSWYYFLCAHVSYLISNGCVWLTLLWGKERGEGQRGGKRREEGRDKKNHRQQIKTHKIGTQIAIIVLLNETQVCTSTPI